MNSRGLELSPGHREEIEKFLKPIPEPLLPDELIRHAREQGHVETLMLVLNQELGNTAFMMEALEVLVVDLQEKVEVLSEENISQVLVLLETFDEVMNKGTQNAHVIIDCLARIRQADQEVVGTGGDSLFSAKSLEYIELIIQDYQVLQNVLAEKAEGFNEAYIAASEKVKRFLEKDEDAT